MILYKKYLNLKAIVTFFKKKEKEKEKRKTTFNQI